MIRRRNRERVMGRFELGEKLLSFWGRRQIKIVRFAGVSQ